MSSAFILSLIPMPFSVCAMAGRDYLIAWCLFGVYLVFIFAKQHKHTRNHTKHKYRKNIAMQWFAGLYETTQNI